MIKKPTTIEVMDTFETAKNQISDIHNLIDTTKSTIEKRLKIINAQCEYQQQQIVSLYPTAGEAVPVTTKEKIILSDAEKLAGDYDIFGLTIHPKFINTPVNIFNFKTTTGYL